MDELTNAGPETWWLNQWWCDGASNTMAYKIFQIWHHIPDSTANLPPRREVTTVDVCCIPPSP